MVARYTDANRQQDIEAQNTPEQFAPDVSLYAPQSKRPGQKFPERTLILTLSGGGQRAASFALGVMAELEVLNPGLTTGEYLKLNYLNEVDYISSVSGGGWGGAAYIFSRLDHQREADHAPYSLNKEWPVLLARIRAASRGDWIERAVDDHILGRYTRKKQGKGSLTLGEVFIDRKSKQVPGVPYLIANAAVYENLMPFPYTPDVLRRNGIKHYLHRCRKVDAQRVPTWHFFSFCEFNREPHDPYLFPFAIGVKASSSVPGFLKPEVLAKSPPPEDAEENYGALFHLIDGGLYDNLGLFTAEKILDKVKTKHNLTIIVDANVRPTRAETTGRFNRYRQFPTLDKMLFHIAEDQGITSKKLAAESSFTKKTSAVVVSMKDLVAVGSAPASYPVGELFRGLDTLNEVIALKCPWRYDPRGLFSLEGREKRRICGSIRGKQAVNVPRASATMDHPETRAALQVAYEIATAQATTFRTTSYQQRLVMDLGRLSVRLRAREIRKKFLFPEQKQQTQEASAE